MPLPTIPSGNVSSGLATGYNVANSVRFNRSDNSYMSRTFGTPTNRKKFTISFWLKRSNITISNGMALFGSDGGNTSTFGTIHFNPQDDLAIQAANGSSDILNLITDRKFRDVGAWYHICVIFDTTQSTNTDRVKLYVNGTQETSFSSNTYPSQNEEFLFNMGTKVHSLGKFPYGADVLSIDGYLAEFVFIDGTTTSITDFGEFDEDSPRIWKPKDVSELTFGNNGCYLDFEDSGDLDDDESGNGNDFSGTNVEAIDQTTDTCTNNFCTINPLDYHPTVPADAEGNTVYNKSNTGDTHNSFATCTIGVTAGKWYYELKLGDSNAFMVGWVKTPHSAPDSAGAYASDSGLYTVKNGGSKIVAGSETGSAWNTVTTNDIIGLAYDFDNLKFYISKNGTWQNSGDPTSGATGTGSFGNIASGATYVPMIGNANYGATSLHYFNFGNPAFTISSGNSDGNGYGNFEYAVPSGYLALCTKNLGSDGG